MGIFEGELSPFQEIVVTEMNDNYTEQAINVDGGRRSHDEAETVFLSLLSYSNITLYTTVYLIHIH